METETVGVDLVAQNTYGQIYLVTDWVALSGNSSLSNREALSIVVTEELHASSSMPANFFCLPVHPFEVCPHLSHILQLFLSLACPIVW